MLAALGDPATDAVWKTWMLSLLQGASSPPKWPVILKASATLSRWSVPGRRLPWPGSYRWKRCRRCSRPRATSRLVRIRAAQSLAAVPLEALRDGGDKANLQSAVNEFLAAMSARPDDWAWPANVGNFYMERRDFTQAINEFLTATKLEPRVVAPGQRLARLQQPEPVRPRQRPHGPWRSSQECLGLFDLGLLLAETGRTDDAVKSLRRLSRPDPHMAAAAYNLGVIAGATSKAEAARWCCKAYSLEPESGKYAAMHSPFIPREWRPDQCGRHPA